MSQIEKVEYVRPDGEIIPPELAVRAMRDSGYKNTAYALAEIIDNSVQAKATSIELICTESQEKIEQSQRTRKRLSAIGVLDNGEGMSPETLRLALQFGNGTHLKDRKGIGRFGMGLPNSSISQCRRLEVWTWQNGPDNAMYTYLDVDEIEQQKLLSVPMPEHRPLPVTIDWQSHSQLIATTGTLILWSNFDEHRLTWKHAKATFQNTEAIVGRMYRKFIADGRITIRLLALLDDQITYDENVRVNDPLYLVPNSSTPPPFDKEAMFQPWGEKDKHEGFPIESGDQKYKVFVRMSWARPETLTAYTNERERGAQPYGKHAAKNVGLSIIREGRELDLDQAWINSYDPTERWWGVEVEFPSALDEVFGVTNTKQNATVFSSMAQFDWQSEAENGESKFAFRDRIKQEGDPRSFLIPIVDHIRAQISLMRKEIKKQKETPQTKRDRHEKQTAADRATCKFKERAEQGHKTEWDSKEFTEEHCKSLVEDLESDHPKSVAQDIANAIFKRNLNVAFFTRAMDGYAFFNVEHKHGGLTEIVFNHNHPFYDQLLETLKPEIREDETDSDLLDRIHKAADTLKLLFAAWARYEMEEVTHQSRLLETRQEWGKMARIFLTEKED